MKKTHKNGAWIRTIVPEITLPSLKDNTADVDRLLRSVSKIMGTDQVGIDFSLIKDLPYLLKENRYHVCVTLFEGQGGWTVIDVLPERDGARAYGLAIDLGSSTVVARLIDLHDGKGIDEINFHNPQIEVGTDILTRIHFASQEGGLDKLQGMLISRLNEEIDNLAKRNGVSLRSIVGMSVAGNTTMTHLFLGLTPYWICREPYIPVINCPDLIRAADLDLAINPGAPVLIFPNIGSYFGGDLIAGILSSGMTHSSDVCLLVDVGTNAEVVLGNEEWLIGCAGAAGPALEGGVANMGMMAGPGVIDKVVIDPATSEITISTIDDLPPVGICGSGLIDLVAQLFLAGMIDIRGKYVRQRCGKRLIDIDGIDHLVIVSEEDSGTGQALTLSQTDIDALIRSKAAMYTILTTITRTVNISLNEISKFYVAGTFGSYIDPRSAITIGMIPDLPLKTYVSLGNTSLEGASMALVSAMSKEEIFRIQEQITYLELNVNQEFMNLFSAAKFIPHTDRSLFPSVKT